MRSNSIQARGGLEVHFERQGLNYKLFVLMAEANWDSKNKQYNGISSMARILGTTDASIIKYLRIYDEEIGRTR